ncbi:MAG: O-antigen ligase family protein [Chitinivibrionales bacterium]|nr:O-antigen ligase family protein [Chitinivibrionales bacterium]
MISLKGNNYFYIYILLLAAGIPCLAYLLIVKEISIVVQIIGLFFLFVVCFFNVRISLAILIFSMLLSPEIAIAKTAARDVTIRGEDLLLLFMSFGWLCRIAILKDVSMTIQNPLNKPILIYCAICLISTALGAIRGNVNPLAGLFFVLKIVEYFILFYAVVNYTKGEKEIRSLLIMMLVVSGIVSIYGLFQVATGGDVAAPFEGSIAERNTLSGYLVVMASVTAGILLNTSETKERMLLVCLLLLQILVILLSSSRSGWVSTLMAVVVLFIQARQKVHFILFFCIIVLIAPFIIPESVTQRIDFTFNQQYHPGQQVEIFGIRLDTSSSARLFMVVLVISNIMNHLFFGYGITGFSFIDGQFVRTLIEVGVCGFLSFVWLLIVVHKILWTTKKMALPPRLKGMTMGFYAAFWALMIHAITANTFIIVRICEPFWCLVGLTLISQSLVNQFEQTGEFETETIPIMTGRSSSGSC